MSRNRTETWLALIVVGIGLIPVAIVGKIAQAFAEHASSK